MKLAYIIFNGISWLDFFGIYDTVLRLRTMKFISDLSWDICSFTSNAADSFGLQVIPNKIRNNLAHYDGIIIPGGIGTRKLMRNIDFLNWIKTAEPVKYKISVCTGSLILGAAGFLKDKKATTHFEAYEILKPFCRAVIEEKIVVDNNTITAGAVTSSIDLGLCLCRTWAGDKAENEIRKRMDYYG